MDSPTNRPSKSKIMKRDDDFGEDRISQLPEEILLQILSYLPTKRDIVWTSALGKRWKSLWANFPFTNIDSDELGDRKYKPGSPVSLDLVQRKILQIPKNERIRKFHLRFSMKPYTSDTKTLLLSLVSEIVERKVEEVAFSFLYEWKYFKLLPLPDNFFTSESLTSLTLETHVILKIPSNICFPRLKTLHLEWTKFQNELSVQRLISACLVLEELHLKECSWKNVNGLTISIPTLQRLNIYVCLSLNHIFSVSCQNIQSFRWWTCSQFQLVQCNLPSLTNAEVSVLPAGNSSQKLRLAQRTLELFERISGIKSLTIATRTLQTIARGKSFDADSLPSFYKLTHLIVRHGESPFKLAPLVYILQKSPNLQSLEFPQGLEFVKEEEKEILKDDVPLCLISSLKTCRISGFGGRAKEVSFLNYILSNATDEDFVFICNGERGIPAAFRKWIT